MRSEERLDEFYDELKRIHKEYFVDWRFNQMIFNYLSWHLRKIGNDGFYEEEDDIINRFREFVSDTKGIKDV